MAYARPDPYGDTPTPAQGYEAPAPVTVQASETPQPASSTPPATTWGAVNTAATAAKANSPATSPYTYGADYRYQLPGGTTAGTPYAQTGGYANQLEGFDTGKLNDPTHTTAKYQFARVASRYAPTQQGFAQLMADPDFQRLGMQSLGNGKIRLPSGEVIDVVRGFQSGGQAWQWGDETNAAAQAPAPSPYGAQPLNWGNYQPYYQGGYGYGGGYGYPAWDPYAYAAQFQPSQYAPGQATTQPAPVSYPQTPATGYYAPPQQLPASPDYSGYGYNQGVGLQAGGGYGAAPSYGPYGQAFQYLGYGLPPPYNYGY